jgi:TATA-box binding protein (TBP) (component of TFIID and TFIIIB)
MSGQQVVFSQKLNCCINLAKVHFYVKDKSSKCIYEPELAPELFFIVDSANVTVSMYACGTLTFKGSSHENIQEARRFIKKLLCSNHNF